MKTEAEIREVIEMLDDIMPNMPLQTGSEMSIVRDALAWTIGHDPHIEYPPLDALIEKHKKRKANRN